MRILKSLACALLLVGASAWRADAQDASVAELLRQRASAGAWMAAESELATRGGDAQTVAALGMVRFARAIETLGKSFHRHGLRPPRAAMIPILRFPVPENPRPEPLTYEALRAIYVTFIADLAAAEATLASLPAGAVKLPIDLNAVRLDLNGDGRLTSDESIGEIMLAMTSRQPRQSLADPAPWEVAFDRADMLWLRGYSRLLSAFAEFALAYDWRESFAAAGHVFFAGAADPSSGAADPNPSLGREATSIADAIALAHLTRWPLAEPQRLLKARDHLKAVIALNRATWTEVLAETDDDREWLPAPHQSSTAFPGMSVTQERIDAWRAALDELDAALDGRKLAPHWRYRRGFDLGAVFTDPRPFDLVLWITGHAALPYLKDGPIAAADSWRQWQRAFGGQFLAYAVWFN